MSSTPLHHDAAVPTRDVLLDRDAMAARFGERLPGVDHDGVRLVKVKYRVGESLRVLYQVPIDGEPLLVAARTTPRGEGDDRIPVGPGGGAPTQAHAFRDEVLGARLWTVRGDRRLPHAGDLLDAAPALQAHVPRPWVRSRIVGYAPEKSLVVACLDEAGEPVAFAKMYEDGPAASAAFALHASIAGAAASTGSLRVPPVVALDAERAVVITDVIRGARLCDVPADAMGPHLRALGVALGRLHACPPGASVRPFRRTDASSVEKAAAVVALARPDCARLAHAVVDTLACAGPARRSPSVPDVLLHGDVHLKNALVHDGRLTLIDLDQAALGSPATDLGSFLALLRTLTRVGVIDDDQEEAWSTSFLCGYDRVRAVPDGALMAWATAAALLSERALRAVARVRYPVLTRLEGLLQDAHALARKAGTA